MLPPFVEPLAAATGLAWSMMIIIESSLCFLGVGIPPPTPTWGGMLAEGRVFLDTAWWIASSRAWSSCSPCSARTLLGDWLRDILDPRLKRLGD